MSREYQPIENYGVIGNLQTVALVGIDGSIDFLCFPYFDSPSIFASLLDVQRGGSFSLSPVLQHRRPKQIYLLNSNILLTRFLSPDGVAEVSDYMPISLESREDRYDRTHQLVRRAKCVRGEVKFQMICDPQFDYGRAKHQVKLLSEQAGVFIPEGRESKPIRLRAQTPLAISEGRLESEFVLRSGESVFFILDGDENGSHAIDRDREGNEFKATLNFWQSWVSKSNYRGRWRETVDRSALVLKLLTSQRHGSIVAAPTFGLPEEIGGARNWDYRYTWIRDASFTLYALSRLGFLSESKAFIRWLSARCKELGPDEALQIMYGIDGNRDLTEFVLPHWEGYRKSYPVRIGNGAQNQLQLDIYGELMDSVYLYDKYGEAISYELWLQLVRLIDWVCLNWDKADEGIWEVRGGRQPLFYSRLMCWVAIDRGLRLAAKRSLPVVERWVKVRDEIYRQIHTEFWNEELQSFVQTKGGSTLDAACLLAPLVRFISPTDPRWLSTLRSVEQKLVDDSLVYRYRTEDGLTGSEGTFCMCSFWYVECVARSGDIDKARFLFEKMLGYANHLGLYPEELGPSGEHLGNFPQAFTHMALISAAFELNRRLDVKGR
ncbi:MAG: glycoside hydrolase family 15 protein [Verrucomicrobia bacterium]|nr:glycoside hydrolase family 15 protein [Verrucomicrobiota bacterium]